MKLNTKKTKGECKCVCHLNPLNKTLGKVKYCSKCICMHTDCQPTEKPDIISEDFENIMLGEGTIATEKPDHIGDVNKMVTEKPMDTYKPHRMGSHSDTWGCAGDEDPCYCDMPKPKLGNPHLISYQQGWNEALAEYKQKLIKRIRKMKYRKVVGGYKQTGELGIATNTSYCEGANGLLDEVEAVIREDI